MSIDIIQKKDLEIFIASQIILMPNYYILFIRLHYCLLQESYLGNIIIVESYKKIMIALTAIRALTGLIQYKIESKKTQISRQLSTY